MHLHFTSFMIVHKLFLESQSRRDRIVVHRPSNRAYENIQYFHKQNMIDN